MTHAIAIRITLVVCGTSLMSATLPFATPWLEGLMPVAFANPVDDPIWWKHLSLLGLCLASLGAFDFNKRRSAAYPPALLGVACVMSSFVAMPFIGSVAVTKLLLPGAGVSFGTAIMMFVCFEYLDPDHDSVNASSNPTL